ncbi:MAG: hypothetical protein K8R85_07500, partial [Bacteroidetes bacterium]|nr:hypothetical protein [Bacteroidota bacterium]
YQIASLIIPGAGASVETVDVTTDINYDNVVGIQTTCTDPEAFKTSTFQNFEIGSLDIYPKGYEAKMLSAGINCPPSERWDKELNEKAQGSTVNITYKDGSVPGTVYPYTVNVYLWLKNPETTENK